MIGAFHNLKPGLIILLVVLCFCAQESYAQDSSPRSFARQQKARQQAEEKARREADAREIERIEAANRASAEKLDQTYQKIVEVLGKLELQNSANAAAEALGYMRKLTVVQTLPSGVLCQNETVKYRWSRSIDDILRDRLAPELLIDKKTCELFFLKCDTSKMYDSFVFRCFVKPDGFYEYISTLGVSKKVRQFRLANPDERQAAVEQLGDKTKYMTFEGESIGGPMHKEPQKNANTTSDGIRQPADGVPKPSM